MPSINVNFLQNLQDDYRNYKVFIETETYHGGTIFAMEPHFQQLHTVEYDQKLYNSTKSRYNGNKINFILGDSSVVFKDLLPTIDEKAIFFLDGHWSCEDTGQSVKDVPLIEEITHINEFFKKEAILIIDGYRLFGTYIPGVEPNWSDISKDKIMQILLTRIHKLYHLDSPMSRDDRLIIHLREIE